jgi:hypothetical protein
MKTKFTDLEIYRIPQLSCKNVTLRTKCLELTGNAKLNFNQNFKANPTKYYSFKNTFLVLAGILFLLTFGIIGHAQQIVQVNDAIAEYVSSSDPVIQQNGIQLNQLIDDANPNLIANPTLLIDENGFKKIDGDAPITVVVKKNEIDLLYSQHPDFENIQMIRIIAENETDMNLVIDLKKLNHFPNLKYVYFYTLFEVCPGNPGNKVCHATFFNNMVSGIEETSNIQVVYKVTFVQ